MGGWKNEKKNKMEDLGSGEMCNILRKECEIKLK